MAYFVGHPVQMKAIEKGVQFTEDVDSKSYTIIFRHYVRWACLTAFKCRGVTRSKMWSEYWIHMANAEPPAGSKGIEPGQEIRGRNPSEAFACPTKAENLPHLRILPSGATDLTHRKNYQFCINLRNTLPQVGSTCPSQSTSWRCPCLSDVPLQPLIRQTKTTKHLKSI